MHKGRTSDQETPLKIVILCAHQGSGNAHIDKFLPSLSKGPYEISLLGWDRLRKEKKQFEKDGVLYRMIFRGWGFANRSLFIALPIWVLVSFWLLLFLRIDVIIAIDFESGLG